MKKIEIFILLLGLTLGGIIGYVMGNYNKDNSTEMQRDRLSDYIRICEDQDSSMNVRQLIDKLQKEDNRDPSLGFKMDIDSWVFAY